MKQVKCLSETCNGRVIAYIDTRGGKVTPRDIKPTTEEPEDMWLFSHVVRPDGYIGFECRCGQDARQSGVENKFLIEQI
jgi:hypothetical protein